MVEHEHYMLHRTAPAVTMMMATLQVVQLFIVVIMLSLFIVLQGY